MSGPIPNLSKNSERFSRLFSLHHWLKNFCSAAGYDFISNFDYFWTNSRLYRADDVHPNRKGTKQLTTNSIQFIAFNSFWYAPRQDPIQTYVSPITTSTSNRVGPATVCSMSQTQSLENSSHSRPDSATADNSNYSASILKFALLNVRSLTNKTFIINYLITSHWLGCILLTETWLDETGSKELIEASPSDFSFSHFTRSNKKGGGVVAIFADILSCKIILFGSYSTFEYLALVMKSANPCLVLTVYHPPRLKKGLIS